MHFCLLLWKASNIPSRHFNDSCLVFPSSRDSTSSANWTICIQNNSNPFISQEANLHYIHDVFRLPINKLLAYASGKNILSPAQKQPTFWHFEEDIWKSERRLLDKNRKFWREVLHNLSTDCKLQDAFCNLLYPGKTRQAVWKLICSDKTWGASPGRNLVFKTVPKEWDIQPQESGHLKNCSNRLGPAQTESEILDHYPAAPKSNI